MSERIGVVGLGKLGLPFAVTLAQECPVVGYDADPWLCRKRPYEHRERGPAGGDDFQECFDKSKLSFAGTLSELVAVTDIVFVLVQTPHAPRFSGETRLSEDRVDFDYTALRRVAGQLASCVRPDHIVAVVSTVLPGTMRREILPIFRKDCVCREWDERNRKYCGDCGGSGIVYKCRVVYNPAFPAMGTVMRDLLEPEFVLLGGGDKGESHRNGLWGLSSFWQGFYGYRAPIYIMSYESAELAKVAYNCAISQRVAYANALGEICHKVPGCDVDAVTGVLKVATKRIVSPRYMDAGMGDGGACLHGDVRVDTPKGRLPIKYLAEDHGEFTVLTADVTKRQIGQHGYKAFPTKADGIRKTGSGKKLVRIYLRSGRRIDCTPDHRFMVDNGLHSSLHPVGDTEREAWDLSHGDSLVSVGGEDGLSNMVERVELLPGRHDVYCMRVPETGWFFAEGVLVHNCHPRDGIAMSWLARKLDLAHDPFSAAMEARERQTEWLARLVESEASRSGLPIVLLGKAYKPESNLMAGSPALLLADLLRSRGADFVHYDPHIDGVGKAPMESVAVFILATKHDEFAGYQYPPGSVVVDPFRTVPDRDGVRVVRIGVGPEVG